MGVARRRESAATAATAPGGAGRAQDVATESGGTSRRMSKDRITAFTDAVLAIVMTLLVLEVKQPGQATWHAIFALRQSYLAYALTFFWLATMWNNHLSAGRAHRRTRALGQ
jgi:uncharacterized membrane protein